MFANLPTPIEPWPLPFSNKNFFIKRDDLTGVDLTGNKVRKLEFLVSDAIANDCVRDWSATTLKVWKFKSKAFPQNFDFFIFDNCDIHFRRRFRKHNVRWLSKQYLKIIRFKTISLNFGNTFLRFTSCLSRKVILWLVGVQPPVIIAGQRLFALLKWAWNVTYCWPMVTRKPGVTFCHSHYVLKSTESNLSVALKLRGQDRPNWVLHKFVVKFG